MTTAPGAKPGGGFKHGFRSLRIRDFRNFWIAGLGMTGAQGITQLALAWLVLDLTGSLGQMGLVIAMQGVAWTIVALVGGVLADRYSRRNLLIGSQFFTIGSLTTLAMLTMTGVVEVWHVYFSALILGTNQALTMPARSAIMRSLVGPDVMMNAVALNSMQQHAGRIFWPSLAGIIIGLIGVDAALLTGAAASGLAALMLMTIPNVAEANRGPAASPIAEMREGVRYSFAHPVLRMMMLINFAVAFFGLAYLNMGPGFSREVMGFDATTTGFFIMASGIGSVTGSMGLVFREVEQRERFVVLSCGGFGLAILLLCLNPWPATSFLIMVFFGLSNSCLAVTAQTIFQTEADQRYLGRVVALWSMGGGIGAITAFPIGEAGDAFGLRYSLGFVAAVLILLTVYIAIAHLPSAERAEKGSRVIEVSSRRGGTRQPERTASAGD